MNLKKILLYLGFILVTSNAYAAVADQVKLSGYVVGFDENNIQIENSDHILVVPKKLYAQKISAGYKITIKLSTDEYDRILKTATKKNKSR